MITSSPTMLTLSLFVGMIAGGIFFAGLWLTVQRLVAAKRPAALVLLSSLSRMAVVLAAFFLVGRGHHDRLLVCLVGFLIARSILVKRLNKPESGKEATGASQS